MSRVDQVLVILKKKGDAGVTSEEIAKRFGFKVPGSASKLINQLRKNGHNIPHENGKYTLIEKAPAAPETPAAAIPQELVPEVPSQTVPATVGSDQGVATVPMLISTQVTPASEQFKAVFKKDKVLEYILSKGAEGASVQELSSHSGWL